MTTQEMILGEVRVMRAEFKEDVERLHVKVNAIHEQTLKTNGRVNAIEKQQSDCPGKKALEKQLKDDAKDSKEYKLGSFVLQVALSATLVSVLLIIIDKL